MHHINFTPHDWIRKNNTKHNIKQNLSSQYVFVKSKAHTECLIMAHNTPNPLNPFCPWIKVSELSLPPKKKFSASVRYIFWFCCPNIWGKGEKCHLKDQMKYLCCRPRIQNIRRKGRGSKEKKRGGNMSFSFSNGCVNRGRFGSVWKLSFSFWGSIYDFDNMSFDITFKFVFLYILSYHTVFF